MLYTILMTRGIRFTDDDEAVIKAVKVKLAATHGAISVTALVRLAIRTLEKS